MRKKDNMIKDKCRSKPPTRYPAWMEFESYTNTINEALGTKNAESSSPQNTSTLNKQEKKAFTLLLKQALAPIIEQKICNKRDWSLNNKDLREKIDQAFDISGVKKALEAYTELVKVKCNVKAFNIESLVRLTLKFGILDWSALLISEMDEQNYQIPVDLVNEFLQMTYFRNILSNYYNEKEEEDEEEDEVNDKDHDTISASSLNQNIFHNDLMEETQQQKNKLATKQIVKYLKKLKTASMEFDPKFAKEIEEIKTNNDQNEKKDKKVLFNNLMPVIHKPFGDPKNIQTISFNPQNHQNSNKIMLNTKAEFQKMDNKITKSLKLLFNGKKIEEFRPLH